MRTVLMVMGLVVLLSSVAMGWSHWWSENPAGYLEMWVYRHEQHGRLLIQMRPMFEGLGWAVDWDPDGARVAASQGDRRVEMRVHSPLAVINGHPGYLDVPPRMIAGVVYVPLRFVCETAGAQVEYMGRTVRVTSADGVVMVVHLVGP